QNVFKYIRSRKPAKKPVGPLDDRAIKGAVKDDKAIAEKLNDFFASVFTAEDVGKIPESAPSFVGDESEELSRIEVSLEEVLEQIEKLNVNKSPGPDGIHPRVLKDDPGNYRPVSLTSVPGKLVETIVKNKIVKHVEEHNLLDKSQHGFCKGKSCLTNLLEFFEGVNKHADKGDPVDIVYLDFQKAFDKVPHQRLLCKLHGHGIRGKVLSWIENWLKDRKQRVGINGKFSDWRGVTSGVPQGSVLGPILFNLFINDLEKGVSSEVVKFADDTKLFRIVKTEADCEGLQEDLTKLSDWATKWQMKFNVDKCKVMHIGKNNPNYTYSMMGANLATTNQERDLGVIVDSSLKTSTQCAVVVKKANRMLGIIRKGIENKTQNILLPLYKTMVRPHLEYCVQMWSPHLKKDILALERVQKRAAKMIRGLE
uniref:Reverse transcriptase domain-containing protein n=1 Tax=Pelodiscus sinensis TaxID=13735 RepID=K7F0M2_PELSI